MDNSFPSSPSSALHLLESAAELLQQPFVIAAIKGHPRGHRIVYVNRAFCRMTGYDQDEAVGAATSILQGPKTDRTAAERLTQALAEGREFAARLIHYRKDGTPLEIDWQVRPIFDDFGKATHFFAVQRDVTRESEARIREKRYRLAIEQMTDPVVVFDASGTVIDANRALEGWISAPLHTVIGRRVWSLPGVPSSRIDLGWARRRLSAGIPWQRTYATWLVIHGERVRRVVNTSASPLRDDDQKVIAYVAVSRDVTERARLEQIAAAHNFNDKLGMAFAGLLHELGNPVNSIKSGLTVMRRGRIPETRLPHYLEKMTEQIERIEYLLDNLRSFGLFDRMEINDLALDGLVVRLAGLVRQDLSERGTQLELDVPVGLMVRGNSRALLQVLLNLIANAADVIGGRPRPTIRVVARRLGRHRVLIEVVDNGPGIPRDDLARIFVPFFTTREGGTGLGLAIVQKLITSMRGTIEVRSPPGEGATFSIVLDHGKQPPRRRPEEPGR